jgi:acetylornithine deacetylase/succinyl-diaminopimelate desuccinylase-like protein
MDASTLRDEMAARFPQARENLERLVRIPSVSFPEFDQANVRRSAEATAEILGAAGLGEIRLLELDGGNPAVYGALPGPEGAPTVLLYAHHDVQPPGPEELWSSPPFEPTEREGRLFGRGTSDDKCGIVMHAAAISLLGGEPPVGIRVIVEGEEESSTEHLPELIGNNRELLEADVVVIADAGIWRRGEPALTTTLRGVVDCTVEIRTLDRAGHSGSYGGVAPDALTVLIRTLAALHDDRGNVAVKGLMTMPSPALDYDEKDFREEAETRPGLELIGDGTIGERVWMKPAITVIGIDAPTVAGAFNQLVPTARAKISMRIAPGQDPQQALDALTAHVEASVPWSAEARVTRGDTGEGFTADAGGRAYDAARRAMGDAWGREPVDMGSGGSVPLVSILKQTFPDITVLLTGAGDELSGAHSSNESVDLKELERSCLAEALLLRYLGEGA